MILAVVFEPGYKYINTLYEGKDNRMKRKKRENPKRWEVGF
jgi:hypothetical protein